MHSTYLPVWLWVLGSHQERCTQDRRPRPMGLRKLLEIKKIPSRADWRGETDNRATPPVGYCPSTASFSVRPYCKNARRDRCQEYHNCFPFRGLEETTGRPRTTWMKTIQQDLRSNNLSLDEAITGVHSGDWCLRLALRTPSGACHTRRRRRRYNITNSC